MKKKTYLAGLVLGTFVILSGCAGQEMHTTTEESSDATVLEETTVDSEESTSEQTTDTNQKGKIDYPGTLYTWQDITVKIPEQWKDKYTLDESENGFTFLQKASDEKEKGLGFLCGFYKNDGIVYEFTGEKQLAYTDKQMYFMNLPTDVSYYYEDKEIGKEYEEMSSYVNAMADSVVIDADHVHYDPEEYKFPMSDTLVIDESDLSNFTINDIRIGRNEIYARHGMKFKNTELQMYFESCSWYEGKEQADTFDDSVLNEIEKKNVEALKKAEDNYNKEHPYPMKLKVGETTKIDLDQDGNEETLNYQTTEVTNNECVEKVGMLVINGESYEITMENPKEDFYYITDISPYEPGLEIAVMDYGPSDDPVTEFYSFDGEIHHLGAINGFPCEESIRNAFANEGCVSGIIRTDLIETCYGYANWWYDYENKELVYSDTGYYEMCVENPHELYMDLTVYTEMNTDSLTRVIPAQKEVFFTNTDGKEWIRIKGKDGTKGFVHVVSGDDSYIIDGTGKTADQVFSDLAFYD